MSKYLLTNAKVTVNGVNLSNFAFSLDTPDEKEQVDVSGFNPNGTREYLPGLRDQTITVGTQVHSVFDFQDLRLSTGYSIYKTTDKEPRQWPSRRAILVPRYERSTVRCSSDKAIPRARAMASICADWSMPIAPVIAA